MAFWEFDFSPSSRQPNWLSLSIILKEHERCFVISILFGNLEQPPSSGEILAMEMFGCLLLKGFLSSLESLLNMSYELLMDHLSIRSVFIFSECFFNIITTFSVTFLCTLEAALLSIQLGRCSVTENKIFIFCFFYFCALISQYIFLTFHCFELNYGMAIFAT